MKDLYDLILEKLNVSAPTKFDGNFLFRFYDSGLQILESVSGTLVKSWVDINPTGMMIVNPVVFVEDNKRIDWLMQIGTLVRIQGDEYDETDDPDYAHIKSVCETLNGSIQTTTTKKYAFKVFPPEQQGYMSFGDQKYLLLLITFNVTEIQIGEYFQASEIKIDGVKLDITEMSISSAKRYYTADDKTDTSNDYNKPTGRTQSFTITFNYNPLDSTNQSLFDESRSKSSLSKTYTLTEKTSRGDTYTWIVTVKGASESGVVNGVRKLTIELAEVEV